MRRGLSLATKLIVAIVVLLVAAVGAGTFYSQQSMEAQARRAVAERRTEGEAAMDRQATLTVRALTVSASPPLAENNFTYLQEVVVAAAREDKNIRWVAVRDAQSGRDAVAVGDVPPAAEEREATLAASGEIVRAREGTLWVYGARVSVGDRVIGSVRLGYSTEDFEEALDASLAAARDDAKRSTQEMLLVAGIILLLAILGGAIQATRMTRQLQVLNQQAGLIAAGQLDQQVQVKSRDEIGQLAASFNVMTKSLVDLMGSVADKASLEREMELARGVQDLMSPPATMVHTGPFSLAGQCVMATKCGGDWWAYRELDGGRVLLVVGDVTGHGMSAAMVAGCARGALEAMRGVDDSLITPTRVLEAMDNALRGLGKIDLLMTCFAVVVDPRQKVIEYANAGHCFPYTTTRNPDGTLADLAILAVRGNPLGTPTRSFNTWRRPFEVGDVLIMATDGLTDRLNPRGERFGDKRYRTLLSRASLQSEPGGARELRDAVIRSVDRFGEGQPADDDVTIVVCHFHGRVADSGDLARRVA